MRIETQDAGVAITTTDIHLARRIGEAVHHAYAGELEYHYEDDEGSVNLTSPGDDEAEWSRGSGCSHRGPHGERSSSERSMMDGPQPVSPHSKQILHDSVDMEETLSMVG